ncbi:MAG: hypothetical protein LC708_00180, partial [Actinobacteria bacterium]|nr:hypothetical protein [Actinomycetota bacterium]
MQSRTSPSATGAPGTVRTEEYVHDAAGRVVATRVGTEPWTCLAYDARGRLTSRAIPAVAPSAARTVTYDHAVGTNPLVTSVGDGTPNTTPVTATADLLGRVRSYTDAWNNTTTSTYDQPGRLTATAGRAGPTHATYDDAGRVLTQSLDAAVVATASYDGAGELATVAYGNGSALTQVSRDPAGPLTGLTFDQKPPLLGGPAALLTSDVVTRSQSGRVVTETVDGAPAPTSSFGYDPVGRLTTANVPGHALTYAFAASGGCGAQGDAGKNTNRTSVVDNGATTSYCYDGADRLTSASDAAVGTPVYDAHGNTTTLGSQTLGYDHSDRHLSTTSGATSVTYVRDATDRIISRTEGLASSRYGYSGPGDRSSFTTDGLGLLTQERTHSLVGGVLVTKRGLSDVWSYPNVHGALVATADGAGAKQGQTLAYDPFGN